MDEAEAAEMVETSSNCEPGSWYEHKLYTANVLCIAL